MRRSCGLLLSVSANVAVMLSLAHLPTTRAFDEPACRPCGDGPAQNYTGACTAAFTSAKATLRRIIGNPGGKCIFDWDCRWDCDAAANNACAMCIGTGLAYKSGGSWWWVAGNGADIGREGASGCNASYVTNCDNTYTFNAGSPAKGTSLAWEGFAGPWDPSIPDCPGWQGLKQVISWTWTMP